MKIGALSRNRTHTERGRNPTHFPLCYKGEDEQIHNTTYCQLLPTGIRLNHHEQCLFNVGAECENRTRVTSLEDLDTTIMPTPRNMR